MFFKFQKLVGILVIPIGMGIFLFSDLITKILLGEQWMEASHFIGLWGLTSAITIVLAHYSSEVYRSIGKPKLSVLAQWLHIIILWPVVLIYANKGFDSLCVARSLVRLELVFVQLVLMATIVKMNVGKMFINILPSTIASVTMLAIMILPSASTIIMQLLYIIICVAIYFGVILLFPEERKICLNLKSILKKR